MNRLYAVLYPLIWIFMRIFHPWKAEGRENVPEGAVVMCGNHTTLGDPIYVVCALGWRCQTRIIAKEELMKIPVLGFLLGKAGIIGIKRGKADVAAIKEAMRVLSGVEDIAICQLTDQDVVRHVIVQRIIKAYDDYYHANQPPKDKDKGGDKQGRRKTHG